MILTNSVDDSVYNKIVRNGQYTLRESRMKNSIGFIYIFLIVFLFKIILTSDRLIYVLMRENSFIFWAIVIISGYEVLRILVHIFSPPYLVLRYDVYSVHTFFSSTFYSWRDIERFETGKRLSLEGDSIVYFKFINSYKGLEAQSLFQKIQLYIKSNRGSLPSNFHMKPEKLAALLNNVHNKITKRGTST